MNCIEESDKYLCNIEKCVYFISLKSEMEYWRSMACSLRNVLEIEKFNLLKIFFEKLNKVFVSESDREKIQNVFKELTQ